MNDNARIIRCVGAGRQPDDEKCRYGDNGWHHIIPNKDTLPYNGIRNWRCPSCFNVHRTLIRKK